MICLSFDGVWLLFAIIGICAAIGGAAFGIYRLLNPKMKTDDKPADEDIVQQELDRVLQPIEDEETAKQINEYKDEE